MTTVSDDLNRPDAPNLGAGWVNHNGTMSIVGGMAKPNGLTTWNYSSSITVMGGNDAEASVTLGPHYAPHDHVLIYVGANDAGQLIFAYFYNQIAYFWTQGVWASYGMISNTPMSYAQGDTLTLRRTGTVYAIFKNGVDTGYSCNSSAIPLDADHRQVGFGLYTDNGTGYRMVDSFSATDFMPSAALTGGGSLSATAIPAPLVLATASGPTNASRDVTITFPGYVPKTNDTIAVWPSCKASSAGAVWPSGWLNPRGGAPPTFTGVSEGCCVHTVTAAEESGGSNTFTLTNYWNTAQTGDVIGLVARYVSAQIPVDASVAAGVGTATTAHTYQSLTASVIEFDNDLYVGSIARANLGNTYTSLPAGFTLLASSNVNQGRTLVRRGALSTAGVALAGGGTTASVADAYCTYSILLVADFPGVLRPAALTGGGTLSATVGKNVPYGDSQSVINNALVPTSTSTQVTAFTLGLRFTPLVDGRVTAIRFYRAPTSTTTSRTVHLWRGTTLVASANTVDESGEGWVTAEFSSSVVVVAGVVHTASYNAGSNTGFGFSVGAPTSVSPDLQAGGAFFNSALNTYPASTTPNNYFADLIFQAESVRRPNLSGGGTLIASVGRVYTEDLALTGGGSLSATAWMVKVSSAILDGAGSLDAVIASRLTVEVGLFGGGTLSAIATGQVALVIPADLTGEGTLTPLVVAVRFQAAHVSGQGQLSALAWPVIAVLGDLDGAGALHAERTAVYIAPPGIASVYLPDGEMASRMYLGQNLIWTLTRQTLADLFGGGELFATAILTATVPTVFSGGGTLSATVTPKLTAAFSGGGMLSATVEKVFTGPADITGLGVWLDAGQLALADGAPVASWDDISGLGINAVSMDTNKPVYTATGFNGLPAVDFSSTLRRLKILGFGTALKDKTEYTLFLMMKPRSFANYDTVLSAPVGSAYRWFVEFDPSGYVYWAHVGGAYDYSYWASTLTLNTPYVLTFSHDNGIAVNSRAYQDGVPMSVVVGDGAGISPAVPDVGADVIMGGYYTGAYWFNGQIAEVIWYDHALTDTQRVKVENYLRKKWLSPKPKFFGGGTLSATVTPKLTAAFSGGGTLSATVTPKLTAAFSGGGALSATAAEYVWTPLAIPGLAYWIDPAQDKAAYGPNENTLTAAMSVNEVGNYTVGMRFQPTASGRITHIRANVIGGSHTFTLWTDAGVRLSTTVDVSSGPREWRSVALPTPIDVVAGTTYRASFSTNGVGFGRNPGNPPPSESANVTIVSHLYGSGVDTFPTVSSGTNHYGVDIVYQKAGRFSDGQTIASYPSHGGTGLTLSAYAGVPLGPKFRSSSIGGKPRIEFFPANQDGLVSLGYNPGTTGLTFVFVGQSAVADNYGMHLVYASNAGHSYELRNEAGSLGVQVIGDYQSGGPAVGAAFSRSYNTDYALMVRVNPEVSERAVKLYINDTLKINAGAVATMPNVASDLRVGHRVDGYFWSGLLAEAMVISGPISDADRAKLMTYLRAKHGALPAT